MKEFLYDLREVFQFFNVAPIEHLDPKTEVVPENKPELPEKQGVLSIDFISYFNFGSLSISVSCVAKFFER